MAATGGAPLCRADAGPEVVAVKQAEGRLAVIAELQRKTLGAREATKVTVARDVLVEWEAEQRVSQERGPAWAAYRAGGVTELRDVVDELVATAPS